MIEALLLWLVADFIGHTNLLPGEMVSEEDGKYVIETKAGRFVASANGRTAIKVRSSASGVCA